MTGEEGAVISVDADKVQALEEMKEELTGCTGQGKLQKCN